MKKRLLYYTIVVTTMLLSQLLYLALSDGRYGFFGLIFLLIGLDQGRKELLSKVVFESRLAWSDQAANLCGSAGSFEAGRPSLKTMPCCNWVRRGAPWMRRQLC